MKPSTTLTKTALQFLFFYFNFFVITAQTLPTAHSFSFSENFSSLLHNSTIYPSSIQGWKVGGSSSSSFRISAPTSNENLNSNSSASTTTGGIHNYNGKIGLLAIKYRSIIGNRA